MKDGIWDIAYGIWDMGYRIWDMESTLTTTTSHIWTYIFTSRIPECPGRGASLPVSIQTPRVLLRFKHLFHLWYTEVLSALEDYRLKKENAQKWKKKPAVDPKRLSYITFTSSWIRTCFFIGFWDGLTNWQGDKCVSQNLSRKSVLSWWLLWQPTSGLTHKRTS